MALDPEKKAELVERLKLARQKKVEMKKQKEATEAKQPPVEKPVEVQEDTLAKVVEKPVVEKPAPEKKENPVGKPTKNKFMKVVYYSEPTPKVLKRMQSIFDESESEEEIVEKPPKLRKKAKVNIPKIKAQLEPELDPADERRAYLKQLANMYF